MDKKKSESSISLWPLPMTGKISSEGDNLGQAMAELIGITFLMEMETGEQQQQQQQQDRHGYALCTIYYKLA